MNIIVDDMMVSYTKKGAGPVVLLVHGWLDDQNTYLKLCDELAEKYLCVAVDLPNFGASQMSSEMISIEQYAHFIQKFVDKLKLKDYTYVGHSMGGQIGIYAVAQKVIRPSKLVLLASAGVRSKQAIKKKAMHLGSVPFKHILPDNIKNKLYKRIGSDYSHNLSHVHKQIIKSVLGYDVQDAAKRIAVPTVLIYGGCDTATPPDYGRLLSDAIDGSKLVVIDNADHWLHQKESKAVGSIMKDFIQ